MANLKDGREIKLSGTPFPQVKRFPWLEYPFVPTVVIQPSVKPPLIGDPCALDVREVDWTQFMFMSEVVPTLKTCAILCSQDLRQIYFMFATDKL